METARRWSGWRHAAEAGGGPRAATRAILKVISGPSGPTPDRSRVTKFHLPYPQSGRTKLLLPFIYFLATVQFAWAYFWLTRPYVNTRLYEYGSERMPFQGRVLMMLPMRVAHSSLVLHFMARFLARWHFWFPRHAQPEVLMQGLINVVSLMAAGWFTTRIYRAASHRQLLTPLVYPLMLVACAATYVLHTVQNFRFIYDLPNLALFAAAMYLIYFRKPFAWFAALFVVATVNRETSLLLLPLYLIDRSVEGGRLRLRGLFRPGVLARLAPLAGFWVAWLLTIHHVFAHNASEFYPRFGWNIKSLLAPLAWPQLLSASGYLMLLVLIHRRRIADAQLRAWIWLIPIWCVFMFTYGILIETRVFGELIPLIVCGATLIFEQMLVARMAGPVLIGHGVAAAGSLSRPQEFNPEESIPSVA